MREDLQRFRKADESWDGQGLAGNEVWLGTRPFETGPV